jgi:hypothetical protein
MKQLPRYARELFLLYKVSIYQSLTAANSLPNS